jgi:hypothetical protein
MAGHIKLGKLTDVTLRDYCLVDPSNYQAATANPYAARVSSGGAYSDLDTFNDWTIQDWHMGVGHTDPEQGQWFSLAESRYPNYLMPPPWFHFPLTAHNIFPDTARDRRPINPYYGIWFSNSFVAPTTASIDGAWVYISVPASTTVYVELRTDDGTGKPSETVLKSTNVNLSPNRPVPHWEVLPFGIQALTAGTRYHLLVKTNVHIETLPGGNAPYMPGATLVSGEKCYANNNGAGWVQETRGFYFLLSYASTGVIKGIYTYNSSVYVWYDNAFAKVVAGALVDKLTPASIISCTQTGDYIYVATYTGYYRYNPATDTYDTFTEDASRFLLYGGYLWRVTDSTIAYTADPDEIIWSGVGGITVGGYYESITAIAGLDSSVYFTTATGLYMVAAGDFIVQVAAWGDTHADNGKGMVAWESALYIPLHGGAIMRYDASGAMMNVGMNAKEEIPQDLRGTVTALCPSNYFLYAHVRGTPVAGRSSSLWSYNVDGWHCLSIGPRNVMLGGAITIDKLNGYLYWGMDRLFLQRTLHPADVNNPANNTTTREYAPHGWVEYDKFYAGYLTLNKDYDRIHIDTKDPAQNITIYWGDDAHYSNQYLWQYLGYVASAGTPVIQFPSTARPSGKWFKLGIRLDTLDPGGLTYVPVLRGVAVKHSTNVADRWRVVVPIQVSDNQQMPDGSVNAYTGAQQRAHLEELIAELAPLQFTDMDGTARTVKVTGASRNVLRYDWKKGSAAAVVEWVYSLTLEEVL